MAGPVAGTHETWSSRFTFIMAAVGSSVGLGNFWRFPFTAGENGGGAFVILYLIAVAVVALPVLMAEYAMGRHVGLSAPEATEELAQRAGKSQKWAAVGWIGGLGSFFIVCFYCVIAGWILAYVGPAFTGQFNGVSAEESEALFTALLADKPRLILWHFIFAAMTVAIVMRGLKGGIETAVNILMPAFFVMLVVVVGFALTAGDVGAAASFLLNPDFSKIGFDAALAAVGQALFSVGVGSSLMMTYGAYLQKDQNIAKSSTLIAGCDTAVALIAGFAVFPIVFAFGLDPNGGPGLFFVTLPAAFGQMPFGALFGGVFFLLAIFAALTSAISLFEVAVSWFEERHGVTRWGAALGLGFVMWMVGVGCIFNAGTSYIDFLDFATGTVILPLGAVLVTVFAGWIVKRTVFEEEFADAPAWARDAWFTVVRYVVPVAVLIIMVAGLFQAASGFLAAG
ncbi:MAG: sodium-dependent transporter [Maricaulaceae bacterium]